MYFSFSPCQTGRRHRGRPMCFLFVNAPRRPSCACHGSSLISGETRVQTLDFRRHGQHCVIASRECTTREVRVKIIRGIVGNANCVLWQRFDKKFNRIDGLGIRTNAQRGMRCTVIEPMPTNDSSNLSHEMAEKRCRLVTIVSFCGLHPALPSSAVIIE